MGGTKAITILIVASAAVPLLGYPAYSQGLSTMGKSYRGPPVEDGPKVDEKAYKNALKHIPTPDQAYDPSRRAFEEHEETKLVPSNPALLHHSGPERSERARQPHIGVRPRDAWNDAENGTKFLTEKTRAGPCAGRGVYLRAN